MICLSSTRFSMRATLLKSDIVFEDPANPDDQSWENSQDPNTGEIVRIWPKKTDNIYTDDVNEASPMFPCLARGVISNGIRSVGNTEKFGEMYENLEYIQIWFPTWVKVTKGDRITNIMDSSGKISYYDEEYANGEPKPTVFNVDGVTAIHDAFNRHIENFALISKAQ